jgi:tryptophan-rich sensory protein
LEGVEMEKIDVASLVAWTSFVVYQPIALSQKHFNYHEKNYRKLKIFPYPWSYHVPLYFVCFLGAIVSIFIYFRWTQSWQHWTALTVLPLFILQMILDKAWVPLFYEWDRKRETIVLSACSVFISVTIVIAMALSAENLYEPWFLPALLYSLFCIFTIMTLVFSIDWYYSVTLPALVPAYPVRTVAPEPFCNPQSAPSRLSSFATSAR